jgi:hypothetical protein
MAGSQRPRRQRHYSNLKLWAFFFACLLTPWEKECRWYIREYGTLRLEQAGLYLCKYYLLAQLYLLRGLLYLRDGRWRW